jgi:peptide-methionine (S)-S-oxide reductase
VGAGEGTLIVQDPEVLDSLFREAVSAVDSGDVVELERLLAAHPRLVHDRLDSPGAWLRDVIGDALEGFFRQPYLLWFVAEDPVRNNRLPGNIAAVTRVILRTASRQGVATLQEQLDYALRLVAWSPVARACGVQIELIDVLVEAGACPDGYPEDALVNGNLAAAARLVERGAPLTLACALCLGRWEDAEGLARTASPRDRQIALVLAALNGQAAALTRLLDLGVDLNAYSTEIYSHATALHHAVWSGSMEAVRVLVEAGAALDVKDTAYQGTPLGWAKYAQSQAGESERAQRYAAIAAYLRERGNADEQ